MARMTRRKLLRSGGQAMIAAVPLYAVPALQAADSPVKAVDYYQKLGVVPFINAAGTYTALTASIMPREVQDAVALAATRPVHLNQLLDASGAYLAATPSLRGRRSDCGGCCGTDPGNSCLRYPRE